MSNTLRHVLAFAVDMEAKLDQNRHKGGPEGWRALDLTTLQKLLSDEVAELNGALALGNSAAIVSECADVANFAMMIADKVLHMRKEGFPCE